MYAALCELARQAPPPVVVKMFSYHSNTAQIFATEAGAVWQRYTPGDHEPAARS